MTQPQQPTNATSDTDDPLELHIGAVTSQISTIENILQTLQIQLLSNIDDVYEDRVDKKVVEKMLKVPIRKQVGRLKTVAFTLKDLHNKLSLLRKVKEEDHSAKSET